MRMIAIPWVCIVALWCCFLPACRTQTPPVKETEFIHPQKYVGSIDEAVSCAEWYAKKMNINIHNKEIPVVERHHGPNADILSGGASDYITRLRTKLIGKDYWVVHYLPKSIQLGGDRAFFIEVSTALLLGHYAGR
jgi:hypothetical protein